MAKNKRIRKKQQKQQLQEKYTNSTIFKSLASFTQMVQFDTKKEKQRAAQQRYIEKKHKEAIKYAESIGYKGIIPKSWNKEKIDAALKKQKQEEKQKRQQQKKDRINQKYFYLINQGLSPEVASELSRKDASWKKIKEFIDGDINRIHIANAYLAVSWADRTGESDLRGAAKEAASLSIDEKIRLIHQMHQQAQDNPDDSDNLKGFAFVSVSNTKSGIEKAMKNAEKLHGYDKQISYNFVNLSASNEFTLEGFVNILYVGMANTSGEASNHFYNELEKYSYQYLPLIHDKIF